MDGAYDARGYILRYRGIPEGGDGTYRRHKGRGDLEIQRQGPVLRQLACLRNLIAITIVGA